MSLLNERQNEIALKILNEYLTASPDSEGITRVQHGDELDKDRIEIIEKELKPILNKYFNRSIDLGAFKTKVDGINKRKNQWGFRGIKGQMFFNMILNVSSDLDECDRKLKSALMLPENEKDAKNKIEVFLNYIRQISDKWIEAGNSKSGRPKIGSAPFFISYFWQIQDPNQYPIYYTNTVNTLNDLNLWHPSGDIPADYMSFKKLHEELIQLYSKEKGVEFDFYKIEHIFWYKGENPYVAAKNVVEKETEVKEIVEIAKEKEYEVLPESYVPPIVAVLPRIALHDKKLEELVKISGTTLERLFEKYIDATFTILGYETSLLGQGKGRNPDGLAFSFDDSYGIIWDAKIRENKYSMGTEDRTIKEYITTHSREVKKKRMLKNIYYFIISSAFIADFDETIRNIKMETDVNEVCLVEAEALVTMVDLKLRAPSQISLGVDGLQRLFSISGIITAQKVQEEFI